MSKISFCFVKQQRRVEISSKCYYWRYGGVRASFTGSRLFVFLTFVHDDDVDADLSPFLQLDDVEAVLELCGFVDALLQGLLGVSGESWTRERVGLLLQLLCACQRCLKLNGDCRPLLALMQQLLPACQQVTDLYIPGWRQDVLLIHLRLSTDQHVEAVNAACVL